MTESAACSRLDPKVVTYGRFLPLSRKSGIALRIARDNTDPELIKNLHAFAAEYNAIADRIDGKALGEDSEVE
jgi:hypothetical protein